MYAFIITALTKKSYCLNLATPLTHSMVGIRPPYIGQKRPLSTVVFLCPLKTLNAGLIRVKSFMVGCIEQPLKRLAVPIYGRSNLIQPTAQRLDPKGGGLYSNIGHKPMLNHTQKPLTLSVSDIKQQSLHKQAEIIGHALNIFCLEPNISNKDTIKHDVMELLRMLDDLPKKQASQSRFNVLNKAKQLVAERVPFDQAKQYQGCIIKFAGMEGA